MVCLLPNLIHNSHCLGHLCRLKWVSKFASFCFLSSSSSRSHMNHYIMFKPTPAQILSALFQVHLASRYVFVEPTKVPKLANFWRWVEVDQDPQCQLCSLVNRVGSGLFSSSALTYLRKGLRWVTYLRIVWELVEGFQQKEPALYNLRILTPFSHCHECHHQYIDISSPRLLI